MPCGPAIPHDPDAYLREIRARVPGYDRLQEEVVAAVPGRPERVLELGVGTGETTRRLIEAHPRARVTGLDASPEMAFRAREVAHEVRLARMEDPLPDGPWDLVIAVLAVQLLEPDARASLLRRVREEAGSLVIGELVEPGPWTPGEPADAPRLAAECGGEVVWRSGPLAVVRAVYAR